MAVTDGSEGLCRNNQSVTSVSHLIRKTTKFAVIRFRHAHKTLRIKGDWQLVSAHGERALDAFTLLHLQAGDPNDAAMFGAAHEFPGCVLYFSPCAARIAMQLILKFSGGRQTLRRDPASCC